MNEDKGQEIVDIKYSKDILNNEVDETEIAKINKEDEKLLANVKFDLEKALDTYDPTFPRYTPTKYSLEFFNLLRVVQGSDFEFNTPIAHYFMVDLLLGAIDDPMMFPYSEEVCKTINIDVLALSFMESRGMAKSTVVITFFVVYSAIKGKLPNGLGDVYFYLILSASTRGGARVNALAVRSLCEESAFIKDYFESVRYTETEIEFVRKDPTGKMPKSGRTFIARFQGVGTGIRGQRAQAGSARSGGATRPNCHAKGAVVTTEYGTYPVEEHPGYKSTGHFEYGSQVKLRGLPEIEVVSNDHQYYAKICVGTKCVVEDGVKLGRYTETTPKFTKVSELTNRHWIGSKIDTEISSVQPIEHSKCIGGKNRNSKGQLHGATWGTELKIHKYMETTEWWWLYGLWLGDGTLSKRPNVIWTIANTEEDTVGKRVVDILTRMGIAHSIQRTGQGCYSIVTSNAALHGWLLKQKGGNSIKNMPNWVLKLPLDKQEQLLHGYIAADGYIDVKNGMIRIPSVNRNVLTQLQVICSRLGLPTYIRNTKQAGVQTWFNGVTCKHNHQWELKIKEGACNILGYTELKESHRVKYKQVHIKDGILWRQVEKVVPTEDKVELVPIQCDNSKLDSIVGTKHSYETLFGISKNCLIFDDVILNTAAAYSKTIQDNLDDIINSDAENALVGGGKGRIIHCFTPFRYGDVNVAPVVAGATTPCVIPIARTFKATDFVLASEIESSWPAMHPAKAIAKQYNNAVKKNKASMFLQERMLRLTSGKDRLVPDNCIQWCSMKGIRNNINMYSTYITTDYTTTSGENSDFSGIATWALSNNGDWFLLNLTLRKRSMEEQYHETLNEAAQLKRRGKNVEIGVEIDGNQSAHVYALEKEMMKRGDYYSFARQIGDKSGRKGILSKSTGVKKHERFRIAVNQYLLPKKMWFPEELKDTPDMIEFIEQIKGATHEAFTRADDGPDLITMLTSLQVVTPTEGIVGEEEDLTTASKAVWGGIFDKDDEKDTSSVIF